jgi:hypothetical protein
MKRFFDTEMVLRPWFRALDPRLKCLWLFMVSRCDMAGVIDMDWGLASFAIGLPVSDSDMQAMNGNAVSIGGNKILIPGFIPFQYGELKPHSPIHKGVFKVLESHGLEYPFEIENLNRVSIPLPKGIDTTKDKDKDKDTEGGCKGETKATIKDDLYRADFEEAWKAYPDKSGKTKALEAYLKHRAAGDAQPDILAGIERYRRYVAAKRAKGQDLGWRNGQTFFNQANWRDEWVVADLPPVVAQTKQPADTQKVQLFKS